MPKKTHMRLALVALLTAFPAAGQSWSLATKLVAPTLFVAVETDFARRLRDILPGSAVAQLLSDAKVDVPAADLALLGRVTALCEGTMEVALGGNAGGMVVHCQLPAAAAARVRTLLDDDRLVERCDGSEAIPVFALRSANAGTQVDATALYLALAGDHLVVASAPDTVRELMADRPRAGTLAEDGDFREFSKRVEGDRPALTVYGSLAELCATVFRAPYSGHASTLLSASGYVDARSFLVAVRPTDAGLLSTVLMRRATQGGLDGWLAWVARVPLHGLLGDLPVGGVGSLTLAFAPDLLRKREADSVVNRFYGALAGGCGELGLDLEQQILQRLKGVAGIQMVATARTLGSAYVARAKSERDAQRLMTEFRRVAGSRGGARVVTHQAGEELVLPYNRRLRAQPRLGAVGDALVLATETGVVEQIALAERATKDGRALPRWAAQAFKQLPGGMRQQVAGAVVLDLSTLLAADAGEAVPLRQHAGCIRVQPDHIRLELFSQL